MSAFRYLSGVVSPAWLEQADRRDVGVLIQPRTNPMRRHLATFGAWAADNDCFAQGDTFHPLRWIEWLDSLPRERCVFATAPDVVGDAVATLRRSAPWLPAIRELGFPAALVAQDGLERLEIPWDDFDALFVGGSTEWKLSAHAAELVAEARARGKWTHIGRVNTRGRLRWSALFARAHSADGTLLRFGPHVPKLCRWLDELAVPTLGPVAA